MAKRARKLNKEELWKLYMPRELVGVSGTWEGNPKKPTKKRAKKGAKR